MFVETRIAGVIR